MADWGQGYSTNIDYIYGFYPELAPTYLKTICRLQGIAEPAGPLTYLELGCGQGLGPNLLAASNPDDVFIGVDFAPDHIAGARRLARAASLSNVTFLEASFEDLAARPDLVPDCDVIVLHGIYSWVGPVQRQAIQSIVRQKLKSGGLLYVSYNCAAGWAPVGNFQRLFRDLAQSRGGGFAQTGATLERFKALRDADFGFFTANPALSQQLDAVLRHNPNYVDHEYMNAHWTTLHFQDVARDMRSCKLTFVGTCNPAENLTELSLPPAVAALVREEPDPDMRESLKDLHCNRRFRKDIYVKGAVRLSVEERGDVLRKTSLALARPRELIEPDVTLPRGKLTMGKPAYAQTFDRLERGPNVLGDVGPDASDMRDVITILLQAKAVHPAMSDVADPTATRRLNAVLMGTPSSVKRYGFVASPVLGSGVGIPNAVRPSFAALLRGTLHDGDGAALDRIIADPANAELHATSSGETVSPDEVRRDHLRWVPIWRHLGLLP